MIPLHDAFLYALGYFEACDGVPASEYMGLRYGQQPDPECPRSWIAASGPALIGAIRRPGGSPPRRDSPTPPPFVPKVPRPPNASELAAMRIDAETQPSSQSSAERRVLRVANWLTEAFSVGKLPLAGRWEFTPADGSRPLFAPAASQVGPDVCHAGKIDFWHSTIEEAAGEYRIPGCPSNIHGVLVYRDILLSYDELFALLEKEKRNRPLPIFKFDAERAEKASSCIVEFGDYEPLPIDLREREGTHCVLMALELLIRFQDLEVSPHLLCSLVWRNVNTKHLAEDRRKKLESMRKALNEIGLDLYHEKIGLNEAHERLSELLSERENPSVCSVIPYVMRRAERPFKAVPDYNRRKSDLRTNIKETLEYIAGIGGGGLVEFLEKGLEFRTHAYVFQVI